jgi:hypothetical protein
LPAGHLGGSIWLWPVAGIALVAIVGQVLGAFAALFTAAQLISAAIFLIGGQLLGESNRSAVALLALAVGTAVALSGLAQVHAATVWPSSAAEPSPGSAAAPASSSPPARRTGAAPDRPAGRTPSAPGDVVDFRGQRVTTEMIMGRDLRGALLRGAILDDLDLRGRDLAGVDAAGASFARAALAGASLRGAILAGGDLSAACLRGADLRGADLAGVDATGADVTGAVVTATSTPVARAWPRSGPAPASICM